MAHASQMMRGTMEGPLCLTRRLLPLHHCKSQGWAQLELVGGLGLWTEGVWPGLATDSGCWGNHSADHIPPWSCSVSRTLPMEMGAWDPHACAGRRLEASLGLGAAKAMRCRNGMDEAAGRSIGTGTCSQGCSPRPPRAPSFLPHSPRE